MPRSTRSKRRAETYLKEDSDNDEEEVSSRKRPTSTLADEEDEEVDQPPVASQSQGFVFSQQIPEASQTVLPERANERRNLDYMDRDARDKALLSLSRMILFKSLENQPIDRIKTIKDAGLSGDKIASAAYQEVASRFQNVFGFELKQTPPFMLQQKSLPAKFKDRYYVVNTVQDNDDGSHSRAIHSVHQACKIEKGVLILTVALIYCKGESRGDGSRHILGRDLYRLMHTVDESIPEAPPVQGTARAKAGYQSKLQSNSSSPNFDAMLEGFCHSDYIIKEKATEENYHSCQLEDDDFIYCMGPRAALELGRRQIITFCAEILGQEPDPSMLKEIENDVEEEETAMVEAH